MSDCAKCKVKKKEPFVGCEGTCKNWFHISCAGYSEADYKLLERNRNVFFWCNSCKISCQIVNKNTVEAIDKNIDNIKSQVDNVLKKFDEDFLNNLLNDYSKKLMVDIEVLIKKYHNETLELIASKLDESHSSNMPTYSKVLTQTQSTFVLQPKDTNQSATKTKSDMVHSMNPVESQIAVSKVVGTRKGAVVVHCNESESKKFKQLANCKLGDKYDVKQLPTLHPRIKIVGMSEKHEADVLMKFIKHQNKDIVDDLSVCDFISIDCLKKNSRIYQAIIQVDINTYSRLMDQGKIFVGYDYCTVYDGIELRRCYKCCNFHHIAKKCHKELPSCPKCAGSHFLKDCTSNDFKCILCSNFQAAHGNLNVDLGHACWDSKCPIYTEALKRYRHSILGKQ